jgi:hypothetical protein
MAERILPPAAQPTGFLMLSTLKKFVAAAAVIAIVVLVAWLWSQEMLPFVNNPEPEIVGQVGYWDDGETEAAATRFLVECRVMNTGRTANISVSAVIRGAGPGFLRDFASVPVPRNETAAHTFAFDRADRLAEPPAEPDYECSLGSRSAAPASPTATPERSTPTP